MMTVGQALKHYRSKTGLSQRQVANQMAATVRGFSQAYLAFLECEIRKNPSFMYVAKLLKFYDVSLDEFAAFTVGHDVPTHVRHYRKGCAPGDRGVTQVGG